MIMNMFGALIHRIGSVRFGTFSIFKYSTEASQLNCIYNTKTAYLVNIYMGTVISVPYITNQYSLKCTVIFVVLS